MKIRVHAHFGGLRMYDLAKENGLSDEAANYFRYFTELAIDIEVDKETGLVTNATIHWIR